MKSKISITIDREIVDEIDSVVDNLIIRNRSQAIESLVKRTLGESRNAVILCGGPEKSLQLSPNSYSVTSKLPGGATLIEAAVKKLRENNFKTIFIVSRGALLTKIFDILKDGSLYGVKVNYVEEKASPGSSSGTASSLRLLKGRLNSKFLVVYGDLFFNKINLDELWKGHLKQEALCTLMLTTSPQPSKKGTVLMEGSRILKFIQKPVKSDVYLVFSPIFAAAPELLEYHGKSLECDVFPQLAAKGLLNGHFSSEKEVHIHSADDLKKISKR